MSTVIDFGTPHLRVIEQAPAGRHEFAEPEAIRDRVEITAGLRKVYAVRVDGVIWAEFDVCTLAIRCKENLDGLDRLGALPSPEHPSVRDMLLASLGGGFSSRDHAPNTSALRVQGAQSPDDGVSR